MIDEKLINDVKFLFENDCTGHGFHHTMRVMKTAVRIAEAEGADPDITALAALLHDADDVKLFGSNSHNAESLMRKYGYSHETAAQVLEIISAISFGGSGKTVPHSLEGRIVQDADRLDAMGAIGIARAFAYGGSHSRPIYDPETPPCQNMTEEEYRNSRGSSVNHFYEKLLKLKDLMNTQTAKNLAQKRHDVMLGYLESFFAEWNSAD